MTPVATTVQQSGCVSFAWPIATSPAVSNDHHLASLIHRTVPVVQDSSDKTVVDTPSPIATPAPASNVTSPPKPPKRTVPRPKVVSTHARQKSEILALRTEADALEAALEQLKGAAKEKLLLSVFLLRDAESGKTTRREEWERTEAKHQHDLLTRARRLNKRLRLSVHEHDRLVWRMRELIRQRATTHAILGEKVGLSVPSSWAMDGTLTAEDRSSFTCVLLALDSMRAAAESKLQLLERERLPLHGSSRRWAVRLDPTATATEKEETAIVGVEIVACEELPFRKSEVDHALQLALQQRRPGQVAYPAELVGGASDVHVIKSETRITSPVGAGIKSEHFATRVFVGSDRTLAVAVAFFSLSEDVEEEEVSSLSSHGRQPLAAVLKYETWTLVVPTVEVDPVTNLERHVTSTRSFSSITPVPVREPPPRALLWQKQFFEHAVLPMWDRALTANHQRLENILLAHQATV